MSGVSPVAGVWIKTFRGDKEAREVNLLWLKLSDFKLSTEVRVVQRLDWDTKDSQWKLAQNGQGFGRAELIPLHTQ